MTNLDVVTISPPVFPSEAVIVVVVDNGKLRTFDEIEADIFRAAIEQCRWDISATARALKVGRSTLYRKMKAYNIRMEPT